MDGAIYNWMLKDNTQRLDEYLLRSTQFLSVVKVPGTKTLYAVGMDGYVKEIEQGKEKQKYDAGTPLSQIVMTKNQKALFVGTAEKDSPGCVQIYKISFERICDIQAHSKPIERMKLSFCNKFLFSTGQDGCLIIYDVNDRDPKDIKRDKDSIALTYSDQVLTMHSELEEYKNQKETLMTENNSLNSKDNFNSMINNKKLEEIHSQLTEEIATNSIAETTKQDALISDKQNKLSIFETKLKQIDEDFAAKKEKLKEKYSKQMLEDSTSYQELVKKKENKLKENNEAIQALVQMQKEAIDELKMVHKKEMETEESQIKKQQEEMALMKSKHEEILNQIREDAQAEKEQIQVKNNADIQKIQDYCLKSKADLQLNKNRNKDLGTEMEQLKRDIQDKESLLTTQKNTNKDLMEEKAKKEKEISDKDNIIGEKEKQIYQYKKKTQELEKFKFVLDYKIKELKADIAPRDNETLRLRTETNEMDSNLKSYNKINANLGMQVDERREKQEKMQKLIKDNRTKIRKNDILIKSFKDDVYEAVQNIDYFLELQKHTSNMFDKYVKDKKLKTVDINPEIQKEYENQRKYLESSKHSLEQKLKKDMEIHKKDSQKHMKENYELITQINDLREKRLKLLEKQKKTESSSGSVAQSESRMSADKRDRKNSDEMSQDEWVEDRLKQQKQIIADLRERIAKEREVNMQMKELAGNEN
mmetsp:Transcript_23102/g.26485  ORF Transcript_23102/g.26485 Transcript_23102/m.26485 type:complete len:703 (-) Transcript_23102:9-2117(-)